MTTGYLTYFMKGMLDVENINLENPFLWPILNKDKAFELGEKENVKEVTF